MCDFKLILPPHVSIKFSGSKEYMVAPMDLSNLFLNWFIVDEFKTSSANLFYGFTVLSVKKYFLMSFEAFCFRSLSLWPLVWDISDICVSIASKGS